MRDQNDEMIAPPMIYAYASLMEGVPFPTGPRTHVDLPVMQQLAADNWHRSGKDTRPGRPDQTSGPGFKARMIRRTVVLVPIF